MYLDNFEDLDILDIATAPGSCLVLVAELLEALLLTNESRVLTELTNQSPALTWPSFTFTISSSTRLPRARPTSATSKSWSSGWTSSTLYEIMRVYSIHFSLVLLTL